MTSGLSGPGPWTLVEHWRSRGPESIGELDVRLRHKREHGIDSWMVEHRAGNGPVKRRGTGNLEDAQRIVGEIKADGGNDWEQLPI